jgi:hypothetical protein
MEPPAPDLSRPEKLWRFAKMAGEPGDLFDIGRLGVRWERLRIRMSSIMRRRSGVMTKLLCEMNGATWRRRIVSQRSCQTRARKRTNV